MTEFHRAEVYYCDFPSNNLSTPVALPTPDYNLRGRHMAIMLTDHTNPYVPYGQALVVPISSLKDSVIRKDIAAYIPLKPENNSFLHHNSYAKANQLQPIDRSWVKEKVGELNPKDMNMVNIGVLLATGTYKFVEQYIDQEVTKRVLQALGGEDVAAARDPLMPEHKQYPMSGDIQDFRRGDVIKAIFPQQAHNHVPTSPHRLSGEYLAVCMTNHFNSNVPRGQVLVVPLLRSDQVVPKNVDAVVPIPKSYHPFLDQDYFAHPNLIQPMNRHWMQERMGQIGAGSMKNVNIGVLRATGSYRYVEQVIDREVSRKVFAAQKAKQLDRVQQPKSMKPGR